MLLPGTFLGVWNLIRISNHAAAASISAAWIQAHGQAQLFGWIGTFILGIGFYSIPKLRRMDRFAMGSARLTWLLWTTGVSLRWLANLYVWHWRTMLPLSGLLQFVAFGMFFQAVAGHRPEPGTNKKSGLELWALIVIGATLGMASSILANFAGAIWQALYGSNPAFPPGLDSKFLVLTAWGFVVPFIWGFSAKWLPIFLGLRATRTRLLGVAASINVAAVTLAILGFHAIAPALLLVGCTAVPVALRIWEPARQPAKLNGVHRTFPLFVRLAYGWAVVGAALGVWAAFTLDDTGITGASRHALTVGFIAMMVFCVGQRILPAFSGMRLLWSTRLMFAGLALLMIGCALRVLSEVLAYRNYFAPAWHWLPISAIIELTAITLFAINIAASLLSTPPAARLVAISKTAAD